MKISFQKPSQIKFKNKRSRIIHERKFRTLYLRDRKVSTLKNSSLLSNYLKMKKQSFNIFLTIKSPLENNPYLNGLQPDMIMMRKDTNFVVRFDSHNPTVLHPKSFDLIGRQVEQLLAQVEKVTKQLVPVINE